ncbi:hypothetical protein F9C07_4898 [Aspergillus flavus]|uniref:Uncharacterized protein n=1 Tax=Aspergillus flavus (strain ATCC 200026 / FGSC A1120 / IAM 13836 / NRRL 3357 / JCM 12722 / SRRC 167) TaxID=332952 RepID=A0A7U2MLB6_ASPFN|nr:hypothetical protein F9C07_4898 [Aspergillus flavus]
MRLHRTRPFTQRRIRQGTNSKCAHTGPPQPRPVGNYCPDHLVGRAATTIYDHEDGLWWPLGVGSACIGACLIVAYRRSSHTSEGWSPVPDAR